MHLVKEVVWNARHFLRETLTQSSRPFWAQTVQVYMQSLLQKEMYLSRHQQPSFTFAVQQKDSRSSYTTGVDVLNLRKTWSSTYSVGCSVRPHSVSTSSKKLAVISFVRHLPIRRQSTPKDLHHSRKSSRSSSKPTHTWRKVQWPASCPEPEWELQCPSVGRAVRVRKLRGLHLNFIHAGYQVSRILAIKTRARSPDSIQSE